MAGISASQSTFGTKLEKNTHNLEEWMILLLNEIRLLRLGDTTSNGGNVL